MKNKSRKKYNKEEVNLERTSKKYTTEELIEQAKERNTLKIAPRLYKKNIQKNNIE